MSHRKFEKPRKGHLGFLPKRRTRHHRGRVRSFPKDNQTQACHLTAFPGFKAGMTHVLREMQRAKSALDKKEVIEAVTIVETPPVRVVGMVGYIETVRGLRALTTLWAQSLGNEFKRRFYKNWYKSKKKCFNNYSKSLETDPKKTDVIVNRLKKYCTTIRLICHTQPKLLNKIQKKANVMEI